MRNALLKSIVIAFLLAPTTGFSSGMGQSLPSIDGWDGPVPETFIGKYWDSSEGVVCYIYSPQHVSSNQRCSGGKCVSVYAGSVGSISCVKVAEPKKKKR